MATGTKAPAARSTKRAIASAKKRVTGESSRASKARAEKESEGTKAEERAEAADTSKASPSTRPGKNRRATDAERAATIDRILNNLEDKLKKEDAKASLGDYIRLVQLRKELAEEQQPREIKVTWVEPKQTEAARSEVMEESSEEK